MPNDTLKSTIDELGLSIKAEFVPFSKSRNFEPDVKIDKRSLNWQVTLVHDGRDILTTDYSAGIAHCPGYKELGYRLNNRMTLAEAGVIVYETEHGRHGRWFETYHGRWFETYAVPTGGKPITPDSKDVIYCLITDADVLDYSSFEEWATSFGYDPDSRKANIIYQAGLKIALQLRNGLGEEILTRLRKAIQDY